MSTVMVGGGGTSRFHVITIGAAVARTSAGQVAIGSLEKFRRRRTAGTTTTPITTATTTGAQFMRALSYPGQAISPRCRGPA
jgi:hypothetical protein